MSDHFLSALALLLVFEGLMPFVSPDKFRRYLASIMTLDNQMLRRGGLISMVIGAGMLYLVRHGF